MKILELNSLITEIKSSLEGLNRRFKMAKEIISELVYREIKIMQSEEWTEPLRPVGHQTYHIHEMRVPRGEHKER